MSQSLTKAKHEGSLSEIKQVEQYLKVEVSGNLFAIPVAKIEDIVLPETLTSVPLAPKDIVGVFFLRQHVVTAIDMRLKLGADEIDTAAEQDNYVVVRVEDEWCGLKVDAVLQVIMVPDKEITYTAKKLPEEWRKLCLGVYQHKKEKIGMLDVAMLCGI